MHTKIGEEASALEGKLPMWEVSSARQYGEMIRTSVFVEARKYGFLNENAIRLGREHSVSSLIGAGLSLNNLANEENTIYARTLLRITELKPKTKFVLRDILTLMELRASTRGRLAFLEDRLLLLSRDLVSAFRCISVDAFGHPTFEVVR